MRVFKHILDSGDIVEIFLEGKEVVMKVSPATGGKVVTLFTHDELVELIDDLSDLEDQLSLDDTIDAASAPLDKPFSGLDHIIRHGYSGAPINGYFVEDSPDMPTPEDVENWLNQDNDSDKTD